MSRGRAYSIMKRTSHIVVVLGEMNPTKGIREEKKSEKPIKAKEDKKEETKTAAKKPVKKAAKTKKPAKAKKS